MNDFAFSENRYSKARITPRKMLRKFCMKITRTIYIKVNTSICKLFIHDRNKQQEIYICLNMRHMEAPVLVTLNYCTVSCI